MNKSVKHGDVLFKEASTIQEFDDGRNLFQQYANSLDIDLCFQDFTNEMKAIDKHYSRPAGALLLAYKDNTAVACVGIREFNKDTAELKRMFVQTEYRGYKIGMKLLELAVETARELNYKKIRLDTLATMTRALQLYRLSGFYEIPPYRFNPIADAVFMEKILT